VERKCHEMRRGGAVLAVSVLILGACATIRTAADPLEAQLAVLRFVMESSPPRGSVPCVAFRTLTAVKDPAADVLQRLRREYPELVPASECSMGASGDTMRHTPTGRTAISYDAGIIEQVGRNEFRLRGGYMRASLNAAACEYVARRTRQGWNVQRQPRCVVA
jgi:hypothetical protein